MKKICILLFSIMLMACGCSGVSTQNETTSLTKGEIANEKLVLKDLEVVSGRGAWDKFVAETTMAKAAGFTDMKREIYIDHNYSEKSSTMTYEAVLRFENGKYTYENITEKSTYTYEYLIERSGEYKNSGVKTRGYYLVNDESVTYDELVWSMFTSQSSEAVDHYIVFTETIE